MPVDAMHQSRIIHRDGVLVIATRGMRCRWSGRFERRARNADRDAIAHFFVGGVEGTAVADERLDAAVMRVERGFDPRCAAARPHVAAAADEDAAVLIESEHAVGLDRFDDPSVTAQASELVVERGEYAASARGEV